MVYTKQTWTDGTSGDTPISAARLSHIEDGIAAASIQGGAIQLAGTGIDPTGVSDSTTAVQAILSAAPDGSTVSVPGGATLRLTGTLTITQRLRLIGPGTLNWVSGIDNGPAILVTGSGTHIDGVRMTSYTVTATTGNQSYAILLEANDCAVEHCTIINFQHGIAVRANGEWLRTRIADNHVLDITGAGGGPADATGIGEDRGDGITCWGAIATITGNVVTAKTGADARIGIHVEGLSTFETSTPALADRMATIVGNTVTGKFRRGIAAENLSNVTIDGNTIADSTWWSIDIVSDATGTTAGVSVSGNTIYWTRTVSDTQGSAYNPARAPIMLYRLVRSCSITGNTIQVAATGSAIAAITIDTGGTGSAAADLAITGNVVVLETGASVRRGFDLASTTRASVVGNVINCTPNTGAGDAGIRFVSAVSALAAANTVTTTAANGYGILHDSASGGTYSGNRVDGFQIGIGALNSTTGVAVVGNTISSGTGVDTNGTTGSSTVSGNQFASTVTTPFANRAASAAYTRTAHIAATTPTGGSSGNILIGTGKIWVNDAGTWKGVAIA